MKKFFRICKFVFALAIIISSIITVIQLIRIHDWTKGLQAFAAVTTAATFCYEEFDEVYSVSNRLVGWLLNKTVSFSVAFYTYNEDLDDQDIQRAFDNVRKKLKLNISEGRDRKIDNEGELNTVISTPQNLNIFCKISRDNIDNIYKIKLRFQISSRGIKNSWNIAKDFRDIFLAKLSVGDDNRCDIEIDMSDAKINPFYKLTIKTIRAKDVTDFKLSADVSDSLKIVLHQYKLYATSNKTSDLEKIIKEYVPLAQVS